MRYLYQILYYRFFRLSLALNKVDEPRDTAILLFSMFQMINFIEIASFFSIISNRIWVTDWPRWILFLIGIGIILLNVYFIYRKQSYIRIEKIISHQGKYSKAIHLIIFYSYILFTIGFFAGIIAYLNNHPIVDYYK